VARPRVHGRLETGPGEAGYVSHELFVASGLVLLCSRSGWPGTA